jgi:hypothetical protein
MTRHDKKIPMKMRKKTSPLAQVLARNIVKGQRPLVSNEELREALGYSTMDAFRQALARRTVPVPVFSLPNRRGKYALVKDVADWLATQREAAVAARRRTHRKAAKSGRR